MKKMPKRVRLLLDEWDALSEKHEQALLADDIELAHEIGNEIQDFVELHCKTLKIPDETMEAMRQSKAESDASHRKFKIAEAKAENSRREHAKAKEKYHEALLKMPPEGKHRTSH